jgi:hypothetical protein
MVTISGEEYELKDIKKALLGYMNSINDALGCEPGCRREDKWDDPNWTCEDCYKEAIEEDIQWIDTTEKPIRGTNYKIISIKTP